MLLQPPHLESLKEIPSVQMSPSHIHLIPSTCFRCPLNIHHFKVPTGTLPPTHSQTCPLAPLARSVMTWSRLMSSAAAKFRDHDLRSQGQSLA